MKPISLDQAEKLLEDFYLNDPLAIPSNYSTVIRLGLLGCKVNSSTASDLGELTPHNAARHRRIRQALVTLPNRTLAILSAYYDERQWPQAVVKALGPLASLAALILRAQPVLDASQAERCAGPELALICQDKKRKSEAATLRTLAREAKGEALESFGEAYSFLLAQEKEAKAKRVLRIIQGGAPNQGGKQ